MRTLSLARRLTPFAVFGAVALSVPALAQSASGPGAQLSVYPACTTPPSKDDSEVAHGAYIAGKRAFDENDYPTAIQYFKDAFRRDCTKYELLNIISRSYELKGDKPEAINALETYLKRAPANDPSIEAIQKRLANLKAQAAADASGKASTSPSASGEPPLPSASVAAAPPPTTTASSPPPERRHSLPPYFLMAGGVVALGVGIPLAIVGAGGVSDANSKITALGCDPDSATCKDNNNVAAAEGYANGPRRTGQIEEGVGIALIGVGAAAVVGGLVWHFVEPTSQAPTQGANVGVRPDARPGYAGLSVGGSF